MSYRGKVISMDQKVNLKEPKPILGLVLTDEMLLELLEENENNPLSFISYDTSGKIRYSCNLYIEIKNKTNLVMAEGTIRLFLIDCKICWKQLKNLQGQHSFITIIIV